MTITKEMRAMLSETKRPTNTVMGEKIEKAIRELPETEFLKEDLEILDYWLVEDYDKAEIVEHKKQDYFMDLRAIVNTGGSEGIYVDVILRRGYYNDRGKIETIPLMTLKTLREDLEAYGIMGRIAGAITAIGEVYLFINWSVIEEPEEEAAS